MKFVLLSICSNFPIILQSTGKVTTDKFREFRTLRCPVSKLIIFEYKKKIISKLVSSLGFYRGSIYFGLHDSVFWMSINHTFLYFKTEEVTTSVFITALWKDYRLAWNPKDYNGLKESRIPGYFI